MPGGAGQKQRTKTRESKTGIATKTEFYPLKVLKKIIRGGEPEGWDFFSDLLSYRIANNFNPETEPMKSFIRWAGSKRKNLPFFRQLFTEPYHRYIEPFFGSGALFFELEPNNAIINDINKDLMDMYECVKECPASVYSHLYKLKRDKDLYYKIRDQEIAQMSNYEKAARFIYLNRFCFNGLYRTNKSGKFNVPYSPDKTGELPTLEMLKNSSFILSKATIRSIDFETILNEVQVGDVVYLDPPYALKNSKIFSQYNPITFGINDIDRLAFSLRMIDKKGAKFILSYANSIEILNVFCDWHVNIINTQRNIAGFSKFRRIDQEIVVTNFI